MDRSFVRDSVNGVLKKLDVILTTNEIDSLVDSILFDWNEIGDPKADFEDLVEWSCDQYITHNDVSNDSLERIDRAEAFKRGLNKFDYKDVPAYSNVKPKYFSMSEKDSNGWQKVTYWK